MAMYIVYPPPGLRRADSLDTFLVTTNSPSDNAAKIKAEKLVGLYQGSGFVPTHFKDFIAVRLSFDKAHDQSSNFVPDVCFQGARIVGPRFVDEVNGLISDRWPRIGRGGSFLRGSPWIANLD